MAGGAPAVTYIHVDPIRHYLFVTKVFETTIEDTTQHIVKYRATQNRFNFAVHGSLASQLNFISNEMKKIIAGS